MKYSVILASLACFFAACTSEHRDAEIVQEVAMQAHGFEKKVDDLQAKQAKLNDPTAMFALDDSISLAKKSADSLLKNFFAGKTYPLPFSQTVNNDTLQVQGLTVTGAEFRRLIIEGKVLAKIKMGVERPYISFSVVDRSGKKIDVAGSIGTSGKLAQGTVCTMQGTIESPGKLSEFDRIIFDEPVKMW